MIYFLNQKKVFGYFKIILLNSFKLFKADHVKKNPKFEKKLSFFLFFFLLWIFDRELIEQVLFSKKTNLNFFFISDKNNFFPENSKKKNIQICLFL